MDLAVISFAVALLGFAGIGIASSMHRQHSSDDYLVAGRSISPWLSALSAVATNNSGFMFIGLLGFTYLYGYQAVWLQLGWVLGDLIAWSWVHRGVRHRSGHYNLLSMPRLLATRDDGELDRWVLKGAALLTFVFLGGYAAAQLQAGATTLKVLMDVELYVGELIGIVIVVAYCFAGGIRASIWTDAAQSIVMILAMTLMLSIALVEMGGIGGMHSALAAQDPNLVQWRPESMRFGIAAYVIGFVAGGFAVVGQPHIMVRMMALRSADDIPSARVTYFTWFIPFSMAAVATGLAARVLLPDLIGAGDGVLAGQQAETALPALAVELMPPVLIGVMLAGVFSATLSTADSQILSCSAAITQDLMPRWKDSYTASKVATLSVAAGVLVFALLATETVFGLVLSAWSLLGASLGPVLLVRLAGGRISQPLALSMMVAGFVTVMAWGASPWAGSVYKVLPGMAVPLLLYGAAVALRRLRHPQVS